MTRVIIFNDRWTSGGVESLIINLLSHFDMKDFSFKILVGQKETNIYDDILNNLSIEFESLNDSVISNPIKRDLHTIKALKRIKKIDADIVHINVCNSIGFTYAKIFRQKANIKTIVHSHNTRIENDIFGIKNFYHFLNKKNEKYSSLNIACSAIAGDFLFNKEYIVLNNGVDYNRFSFKDSNRKFIRKELKVESKIVLLNIGRLSKQKNQFFLIDVLKELFEKNNKYHLLLIGDGHCRDKLIKYAQKHNVSKSITFLSPQSKIEKYYSAADIFLLPSLHEGLPVSGIEAQANGLPSIFSNTISNEVLLCDNSVQLPIKDPRVWSEYILNHSFERVTSYDCFKEKKYLIENSSKELRNIYLSILKGENK